VRASLIAALARVRNRPAVHDHLLVGRRGLWIAIVAFVAASWLLRERRFFGDSTILVYQAMTGAPFAFPEIGGSFLLHLSLRAASGLGAPGIGVYQLAVCLCGGAALASCVGLGRALGGSGALVAGLVLCGGLARVFAGHVEVYAWVVACGGVYLWAGVECVHGRRPLWVPALALGVGLWLHLSFLFLVPSWLALPGLRAGRAGYQEGRPLALAAVAILAPTLGFLAIFALAGATGPVAGAWDAMWAAAGVGASDGGRELWLRLPGSEPGAGTRYAIFGAAHLKYLVNALFMLAPALLPLLVVLGLERRRPSASPDLGFLGIASLSMLAYATVLRPIWGPYDWDLFSLFALCGSVLAAAVLMRGFEGDRLAHLATVLIAGAILLVGIPLLAAGIATPRDAGPFSHPGIRAEAGLDAEAAFERQLAPWL